MMDEARLKEIEFNARLSGWRQVRTTRNDWDELIAALREAWRERENKSLGRDSYMYDLGFEAGRVYEKTTQKQDNSERAEADREGEFGPSPAPISNA